MLKKKKNQDPIWTFSRIVSQKPDQIPTFGRYYCFKVRFVLRFIQSAHNLKSHFMHHCLHFKKLQTFEEYPDQFAQKNLKSEPKQGHCKLWNEFCMIRVLRHLLTRTKTTTRILSSEIKFTCLVGCRQQPQGFICNTCTYRLSVHVYSGAHSFVGGCVLRECVLNSLSVDQWE